MFFSFRLFSNPLLNTSLNVFISSQATPQKPWNTHFTPLKTWRIMVECLQAIWGDVILVSEVDIYRHKKVAQLNRQFPQFRPLQFRS